MSTQDDIITEYTSYFVFFLLFPNTRVGPVRHLYVPSPLLRKSRGVPGVPRRPEGRVGRTKEVWPQSSRLFPGDYH